MAVRRGVVGALASGDARVRRACGAVRKGARAEAGWCRAPHARAEGFMGVRLRRARPSNPDLRLERVAGRHRNGNDRGDSDGVPAALASRRRGEGQT